MPVKAKLANGARHAARRRFYFVAAANSPVPTQPFFDAGFTPMSPRLVNTAQVTLPQGPSSGSGGPSGAAQQSKGGGAQSSSSTQPSTSTTLVCLPSLPLGGTTQPGSNGSTNSGYSAHSSSLSGGLLIPTAGNYSPPSFFPSILGGSTEKGQSRSTFFRLESGAYGIPKTRSTTASQRIAAADTAPSPPSSSSTTSPSPTTPLIAVKPSPAATQALDLSCQIGDDAYFVQSVSIFPRHFSNVDRHVTTAHPSTQNALGVADGVGGWSTRPGGNSALFSRRLMHYCSHEISLLYPPSNSNSATNAATAATAANTPPYTPTLFTPAAILAPLPASRIDVDPVDILQRAYERTLELCRADGSLGSSTALVAVLLSPSPSSPSNGGPAHPRLRIAHIGDCLIGLIRQNELIYRSSEQQHRFNYPYQLGPQSQTTPKKDAIPIDLPVQEGDVIVLATDGLGDNLWDEDVLEEAIKFGQDVRGMSEALAKRAKKVSESGAQGGETPFARRAQEENKAHVGGKVDGTSNRYVSLRSSFRLCAC